MIGWPLVAGLVRSVAVAVPGVRARYCAQMALAVDQHPVRALGPHGPYPPFGMAVRPGCLRRVCTIRVPSLVRTSSNARVKLASRSRMRKRRSRSGLRCPAAGCGPAGAVQALSGWLVTARMCTRLVAASITKNADERLSKTVSTVQKSPASRPSAWARGATSARKYPGRAERGGTARPGGFRRTVASLIWWPRRVSSPGTRRYPHGGVLRRQPQDQAADFLAGPGAAWSSRIGPFAGEETAVPGQQSSRRDKPANTQTGLEYSIERLTCAFFSVWTR